MSKTFDELFDDFLNNRKKPKKTRRKKQDIPPINLDVNGYIDNLGKPDKIEFYNEGPIFLEKRTWFTEHGNVVKIIVSDEPSLNMTPFEEKPLEEQLYDAVVDENYEKAAVIRDLIAKEKKNKK